MATKDENPRCAGCGHEMAASTKVYRIALGAITKDGSFDEKKEFALLEESCFLGAVDSPELTMRALKQRVKAAEKTPAPEVVKPRRMKRAAAAG